MQRIPPSTVMVSWTINMTIKVTKWESGELIRH